MKEKYYTDERNIQILISLLKEYGIKKIIASPGTTNLSLVGSLQQDPYFEMFSSVDERSAAYLACGLAAESGEAVMLSCTGATASRNYMPGLTEAFYRKLPILAVTSSQEFAKIGHNIPQVIDRRTVPNDIVLLSEQVQTIKNETDEWDVTIKLNRAIQELWHRGGGPVHINLSTVYSRNYSVKTLPSAKIIKRYTIKDQLPPIDADSIGVIVGAHLVFTKELVSAIDSFCSANNAVVFCDHTSSYNGKYRVQFSVAIDQRIDTPIILIPQLVIYVGEVSGDYSNVGYRCKKVWRISEDGLFKDPFGKLSKVFEMDELSFFRKYTPENYDIQLSYYNTCIDRIKFTRNHIPDLPFSNAWIAQQTAHLIPENSTVYLSILNTLRTWNFFEFNKTIHSYCNTGGFGIDGILSSLIGASLVDKYRLYFGVIGDLAFFFFLNVLGNRHIGNNVRILLVNNGKGTEFKNYDHPGSAFGVSADLYMAAGGHYGRQSHNLVKHYAEDLGFHYLTASTKEEYLSNLSEFITPVIKEKPILFEVFTNDSDESEALHMIRYCCKSTSGLVKSIVKNTIGEKRTEQLKKFIKH